VPAPERTLRVTVGLEAIAVVLGAIAVAVAAFGIAASASRTIGWAVACATVAALIEPPVSALARHIPRPAAIATVLLLIAVTGGGVASGVLTDLDRQFDRLTIEAPRAAAELEDSDRFGDLARDFRLEDRVNEMLERLQDPTSGLASEAPNASSTYLICAILVAFFLSWGPKLGRAALVQLPDDRRRSQVRALSRSAFSRARRYCLAAIGRAALSGLVAFGLCRLADVPAAAALAAAVAGMSVVPGFGIVVGALPALLLKAGLDPGPGAARLAAAFVALQIIDEFFLRQVVAPRSLTVGPAAIVIAMVIGFEIYGIGGAFYGTAIAILGVALLDAIDEYRTERPRRPAGPGAPDWMP
jgi:predicted PurR-regulated permease PerM